MFTISASRVAWVLPQLSTRKLEAARSLILSELSDQHVLVTRLRLVKSSIKEILVSAQKNETGDWCVEISLIKLLRLPGIAPKKGTSRGP